MTGTPQTPSRSVLPIPDRPFLDDVVFLLRIGSCQQVVEPG